jgi:hypothetical protein
VNHSITERTTMLATTVTTWVLPPLLSTTAVLARAPQLTKHLKKEPTTFAIPRANNSFHKKIELHNLLIDSL